MQLFTSESVTEGHPDKLCDQVSDAILDAVLREDPKPAHARVAIETLVKTGVCVIAGEVTSTVKVDYASVARRTIRSVGYDDVAKGFDGGTCAVLVAVEGQSPDIAQAVNATSTHAQGAGDQGMMFGFACDETPELMPLPIVLAHRLSRALAQARRGPLPWLHPDGKTQVTVAYDRDGPAHLEAIVVSAQHPAHVSLAELREALEAHVVRPSISPEWWQKREPRLLLNPGGRFVVGGPQGDAGLTGRKNIVDGYGGMARHGGGALSGKDPSKVDRSAAYLARFVAKNIVAAGLARRCEVQLAYAIGVAQPVSVSLETFGTASVDDEMIVRAVSQVFRVTPAEIIADLDLLSPRYHETACYGHFGRPQFPWERTDRAPLLRDALGLPPLPAR